MDVPSRRRTALALLGSAPAFVFLMLASTAPAQPAAPGVDLKPVDYRELCRLVRDCKGKVVVVDVWASYCAPCKKAFPDLVQLHRKYQKEGLVCMSVTVDAVESRDEALRFLKAQDAAFANYLLAEEAAVWQERWDINGPPAVFVFNRRNERAARFDRNDPSQDTTHEHDAIEKLVRELLREAP